LTGFVAHSGPLAAQEPDRTRAESIEQESIVLAREGSIDNAIKAIDESIKADPSYASAYIRLGNLLMKKGSLDEAFSAFDKALTINPGLHGAKQARGLCSQEKETSKMRSSFLEMLSF